MKGNILGFTAAAMLAAAMPGLTHAEAADQATVAPELKNYQRTGQFEKCLTIHRISDTRILNNHQILFTMLGGEAYLSEPRNCSGLSKGVALVYDATLDQLCNSTIVHLRDTSSPVGNMGSCGIESFEKLTKTQ